MREVRSLTLSNAQVRGGDHDTGGNGRVEEGGRDRGRAGPMWSLAAPEVTARCWAPGPQRTPQRESSPSISSALAGTPGDRAWQRPRPLPTNWRRREQLMSFSPQCLAGAIWRAAKGEAPTRWIDGGASVAACLKVEPRERRTGHRFAACAPRWPRGRDVVGACSRRRARGPRAPRARPALVWSMTEAPRRRGGGEAFPGGRLGGNPPG